MRKKIPKMRRPITARPPMTPPTMAPTGAEDPEGESGVEVGWTVVVVVPPGRVEDVSSAVVEVRVRGVVGLLAAALGMNPRTEPPT